MSAPSTRIRFIDLHLFSLEKAENAEELFAKYSSNINYIFHLKSSIEPIFVIHARQEDDFVKKGIRFIIRKSHKNNPFKHLSLFWKIRTFCPQVVMLHGMIAPWYIMLAKLVLGRKVKIIVQNHAEQVFSGWRRSFQKLADRFISSYLFVSQEQAKNWVKENVISNLDKVHEVMEGSNSFKCVRQGAEARRSGDQGKGFIWVGRLDANKDPLTILRAFGKYLNMEPQAKLTMIYGTLDLLNDVEKYIQSNHLEKNVEMKGRIEHSQLESLYNAADYFILGSHYEGSGYALCEAMACGCIPIVTRIPSFLKMTNSGECAYLFTAGNEDDLLAVLAQLKRDEIEVLREKVLKKFEEDLSYQAIANNISRVVISQTS